ncbi:putative dynamin GTPase [Aspergillus heteromorphus CBS 117.55]|uniref:Putative dynamin GTPase n=1 Tax=Aspergillus heteromorphus CBS 117.55 TaxID=1448321 RepID=A0A317VZC3_9EURO|nr:putative dynamin GTPase [Aspergillus heteromorphus CBS 117.55]PWY78288.1 putative dynamin GTPase [Aspergillus heteromorphus CBS 117.55]
MAALQSPVPPPPSPLIPAATLEIGPSPAANRRFIYPQQVNTHQQETASHQEIPLPQENTYRLEKRPRQEKSPQEDDIPQPENTRANTVESTTTVMSRQALREIDSINLIAGNMKELVKRIQDLRHIGIEDNNIDLPKICVIGDQSAGKSSLIEGMSEIKVPRCAGTCTRCPMEINLSESEPGQSWTCKVFLSRRYMYDESVKFNKVSQKSRSLGPWHEQDQEDEPFITLTNKKDVQEAIRWAQIAILNPKTPSSLYTPGQNSLADSSWQVKFSPNIVRLDITAPGFPNLSFYDLPGVISQAEQEDERYLVTLVENLVREYIAQPNCIVLLTLPMTNDATNSGAARIMQEVKGAKERTLGVLTKPDRVQAGESHAQWVEILQGGKFSLGYGYYVVRNNPDPEVEHAQAREEEETFFASDPWVGNGLAVYEDKFGTRRLQAALSTLLLEQIQGCLPRIIEQINKKADRIDSELQTLPDPPTANVQYILCRKLNEFKDHIRAHVNGGSSQYPLQKIWVHIASDFKRALAKTRPTVRLLSPEDRIFYTTIPDCEGGSDSDCEMTSAPQPVKRKSPENPRNVPTPPEATADQHEGYYTEPFKKFQKSPLMFTWETIREINEDSYRAGLPDQTDPKAIEIMNQMSVKHWCDPLGVFLNSTYRLVRDMLLKQLNEVFAQFHQTGLYRELKRIIIQYLRDLRAEHFEHAQENFNIEYNKPFTMATSALDLATKSAHQYLSSQRQTLRAGLYLDTKGKFPRGDARREAELRKLSATDIGPDRFAQELKMMANTRAYYDMASSRFVDSICQGVHTKLFAKCREELISVIESELRIFDDNALDRCLELMTEDPERQRRRLQLLKEREKITKAQEWLNSAKKEDEFADTLVDDKVRIKSQPPDEWTSYTVSTNGLE